MQVAEIFLLIVGHEWLDILASIVIANTVEI